MVKVKNAFCFHKIRFETQVGGLRATRLTCVQDINEEWISDKTRFCYDGLKRQRLNDPMIRGADGRFKAVSWRDALSVVAEVAYQVKPEEIVGIAGKLCDAESLMAFKDFLNKMGSNNVWCEGITNKQCADLRSAYLMNTGISGLEKADCFLLVGTQVYVFLLYFLPPLCCGFTFSA